MSGVLSCELLRMTQIPVFIADSVGDGDVWQLRHDPPRRCIHEIKCPSVIWFFEAMLGRESFRLELAVMLFGSLEADGVGVKPT